jgi:hypothetical protein
MWKPNLTKILLSKKQTCAWNWVQMLEIIKVCCKKSEDDRNAFRYTDFKNGIAKNKEDIDE